VSIQRASAIQAQRDQAVNATLAIALGASDIRLLSPSPQQHRIFFISTPAFLRQRHLLIGIATDARSRHLDALTYRIIRPVTRTSSHRYRCRCPRVSPLDWQTAHTRFTPGVNTP
jgi:hypothetical protein